MSADIQTEAKPENNTNMVVVGRIAHRTMTHVGVVYPSPSGQSILVVNRQDINTTPSTGLPLPNRNDRVYAFTRAVCPSCNNEPSARRQIVFTTDGDGNEVQNTIKCASCDGKGHISDFTNGHEPVIDDEAQELVDSLAQGILPDVHTPAFQSMMKGGRNGIMTEWDVHITPVFAGAMVDGEFKEFTPAQVQHFNTDFKSDEMPHGLAVGRPKTGVYHTLQHREALEPFIAHCDNAGLRYSLWGSNGGQDAYMDIMLAENGTRHEVIASLRALRESAQMTGDFTIPSLRDDPNAVIKFGVQLHHSFDGAFTIRGYAERVACLNGMVATDTKNLLSVQHKHGVMAELNFTDLVPLIIQSALELYGEMLEVDAMNNLSINDTEFESILVLAEKRGLLSFPSIGKNNQLTGGRVFRCAVQGWADPSLPWVSVGQGEGDSARTLNHIYNILTGILTHQVEANDAHGKVTGGKAISVTRVQQQLRDVHTFMREIQNSTRAEAFADGCTTLEEVAQWVEFNGHPMLNNTTHADADEGHILPRITVHMGTNDERSVQLTSVFARPMVA